MDRYDPAEWTQSFVSENSTFCFEFLQSTNQRVIELLKQGDYAAALAGIDRMLSGAATMHKAQVSNMLPFLATNSFNAGIIATCGLKGVPDDKRRQTAIAAFEDARDFSSADLQNLATTVIGMLKSGRSFESIKAEISPNFPQDVIELMSEKREIATITSSNNGTKRWVIIAIIVTSGLSLLSFVVSQLFPGNTKPADKYNYENTSIISEVTESAMQDTTPTNAEAEEYLVTADTGLRLRSKPSTDSETITVIPKNSTIKVFEIANGWAKAEYKGQTGYCSQEFIVKNDANQNNSSNDNSGTGEHVTAYSTENMHLYSQKSKSSSFAGYVTRGESLQVISNDGKWACIELGDKQGWCPSDKISKTDVPFVPQYTGEPSKYLFEKMIFNIGYSYGYPISLLDEMLVLNKNDSYPIYFYNEDGSPSEIATYGYTAKGYNSIEDIKNLFRNFCTEKYIKTLDFSFHDSLNIYNGKYYFNGNYAKGWNCEIVKSYSKISNNTWSVKVTYEYTPEEETEYIIVLENGKYKIDQAIEK